MPTNKDVKFTYVGGPTLLIEFGGVRFLTDPTFDPAGTDYPSGPVTLSKTMGPAVPLNALGKIDAVLLSHDHHSDNLDHAGRAMLPSAGVVLTTIDGAQRLGGNAIGLAPWKQHTISNVTITATPAQHGPEGADRGPVIGFLLQKTDGDQNPIYISGDTVWFKGVEETIENFPEIATAVLFMGAAAISVSPRVHLTLTADEGVLIARDLPGATIIPVHFEGWKHFTESRQDISAAFGEAGWTDRLQWPTPASGA